MIRENIPGWTKEIQFCDDSRVVRDWLKYNIRKESTSYSKIKVHEKREKIKTIEQKFQFYENHVCGQPTPENLGNLVAAKLEYEREDDYIKVSEAPSFALAGCGSKRVKGTISTF